MEATLDYHLLALPMGEIMGALKDTVYGDEYYSFEGIPYGQPPVGDLRFKAPLPVNPWAGVWECIEFSTKPIQINLLTGAVEGSEDCLYLNVYAKKLASDGKPLPVLVWIYGGCFSAGGATRSMYGPDYFMMEDIVVVTFNYRLSALGFLSVKDPAAKVPGNAGLKDQILALKWVKKYIKYFNGDPNNITVAGNSAGSSSIHCLLASEQAKNLFHKAICMSGTVFNPWAITNPEDHAYRVAKLHGYNGDATDCNVIEYLQGLDAEKLAECNILNNEDYGKGVILAFTPCIEPYVSDGCVIPSEPREMLKTCWSNDIPVIFSGTSAEGLLMFRLASQSEDTLVTFRKNPEEMLPYEILESQDPTEIKDLAQNVLSVQFLDRDQADASINDLLHFLGIKTFWHGIHRSLLSRLEYSSAPTYLYRFSYDSPNLNQLRHKLCGLAVKSGASHADDVAFLWFGDFSWELDTHSKEFQIIREIIKIIASFASNTSDVSQQAIATKDDEVSEYIIWSPIQRHEPHKALDIGEELTVATIPESNELLMWDTMYTRDNLF